MSLSNFPNLTKSINTAFAITPPTSTLSTTYGTTWTQLGSTFAGVSDDVLGVAMGMSNDGLTIAFTIGRDDAGGTNRGSVKVYRWINSTWTLLGNPFYGLVDNETLSGISLGYDGNTIAINYTEAAQWTTNTSKRGFCAVFYYNPSKTTGSNDVTNALFGPIGWSILGGVIYNEGNGDNAVAVKLSGNNKTIAIGIPNNDGTSGNINDQRGSVRVYSYDATKTIEVTDQSNPNFGPIGWTRIGQDIDGLNALDNFGAPLELSVDGGIIVVGCPGADDLPSIMFGERLGQTNFGHAKVLYWTGSTWAQRGRNMYPQLYSIYDYNSYHPGTMGISSDGNIVALGNLPFGSYGGITSTWIWNATSSDYMPLASQVRDFFDWAGSGRVTLNSDGTVMAVGANDADNNTSNGGTLRVYKLTTKSTTLISTAPSNMAAYISDIGFGNMTTNGTIYRVTITGAVSGGTIWGTNIYRHDSNLAMAAVHAGVVANGETKEVFVVMERPQVYYFNTTRLGITSSSHGPESSSYPMGSYGAYFFQTTPRHWVKIGNDIFGAANEYLSNGGCLLSCDGTRVMTGSWFGGAGMVKVFSITSFGQFSYTSSNPSIADVKGFIAVPLTSGQTTITATQSASGGTPQSTIAATLTIQGNEISSNFSASTFTVDSSKAFGDASFAIITRPTSNSSGAITYSSSNPAIATIDVCGNWITLVGVGDVSFNATQAQTAQYLSATKASNTLTVMRGTPILSTFTVASSKTLLDASFVITAPRPTSNSNGAITYSSSNPAVATIDASGNWITLVSTGDVSFNATQAETTLYISGSKTSNTLTVSKATPTLAFESPPPATKSVIDEAFTVTATSASPGAITYTSSNISFATVGLLTGLVTITGAGTVTITATQAETALYASTTATYSVEINSVGSTFAGQIISPETSFAGLNFSGASLAGTTLSGVSFSGATLTNVDFSGAIITGTNFTNANISGATNLPAFSTAQKLQLLSNINNVAIGAVQIAQLSGSDINAILPTPVPDLASATFAVKAPSTLDASSNKLVTITNTDISNNTSIYIPLNTNESVNINGAVLYFNGTSLVDASNNTRTCLTIAGVPFKIYAGSIIALNILNLLNKMTFAGGDANVSGLYDIMSELFVFK
jgi:hypothetical protein